MSHLINEGEENLAIEKSSGKADSLTPTDIPVELQRRLAEDAPFGSRCPIRAVLPCRPDTGLTLKAFFPIIQCRLNAKVRSPF
jgi:hypothetical protein